jgi:hypothetical protein
MLDNNMEEVEYDELETCELSEDEKELSENDVEVDHDCPYYVLNCHISLLSLMCCFFYTED